MSNSDARTSKKHIPRYSVVISIDSLDNKLRVASTNKDAIYQIIQWYEELTNEKTIKDKSAKYTNAFILNSALKQRIFGNDWIGIIVDFMFSVGYELIGDGNFVFDSNKSKQLKNIMFISTNITHKHLKLNYAPKIKKESTKQIDGDADAKDHKDYKPEKQLTKKSSKNKKYRVETNDESKDEKQNKLETKKLNNIKSENKNDNKKISNTQNQNHEDSLLIQSESSPAAPAVYGSNQLLIIDHKNKNNKDTLNKINRYKDNTHAIHQEKKEQIIVDEIKNDKEILDANDTKKEEKKDTVKQQELEIEHEQEEQKSVKTSKRKKKKKKKENFRDDPKKQFKRRKSRNKSARNRAQSEGNVRFKHMEIEKDTSDNDEEKEVETESMLMIKKMNVDEMIAIILHCLHKKKLISDQSDVRLITNLVKVNLKLTGAKFVGMSRKEFESKFKWLRPTQASRLYDELKTHLSKHEIVRILKKAMVRSKSSSKRKKRSIKGKRQKTRIQLTVDSDDGNHTEDSDGF